MTYPARPVVLVLALAHLLIACGGDARTIETTAPAVVEGKCVISGVVDSAPTLGCKAFEALASVPLDANIPGARSAKVVLDQLGGDVLYFQNSQKFQIRS